MDSIDDLLADVVDGLPIGAFALDVDCRVRLWNAHAERLTGWTRDQVLGRSGVDLAPTPVDDVAARRILDGLLSGRPYAGRFPAATPAAGSLYVRATLTAGRTGPVIVGVLQDIAETRVGDEAFALLDALWETAPVGLAYFDTDLRYRRVNGAVVELDGGSADDRIGRTVEQVHGAIGIEITAALRAVRDTGVAHRDVPLTGRLWHGRGPLQEWRLNYYPVRGPDGTMLGVGVVLLDVTAAERTRRELAEVAAQREHALNRYQSLVEATSEAVWILRTADGAAEQDAPGLRVIIGQYLGHGYLDAVHPADRDGASTAWAAAVIAEEAFTHTSRLRTGTGYRWFRTRAVPVRTAGRVAEWVGTEADIDDEVRARDRLDVLARATLAMNAALDPEAELTALAEATVPEFADLCRAYLVDPVPIGGRGVVAGRRSVTRLAPGIPPSPATEERFVFAATHPVARSAHTGAPVLVTLPVPVDEQWYGSPAQHRWGAAIGLNSMLVAPVLSGGQVVAALLFLSCGDRPVYTADDLALVGELAARASTAVEHAVTFQQTRQVSLALQTAMLTEPPCHPGVQIDARYLPAVAELEIGGDWFDAFTLPGGDLALGVGDVVGHDLPAAATMGQLRSMLRALAYDSDADPSDVLRRLDRVASRLDVTRFTTLLYGRLHRDGDRALFRWSNAGHPMPILISRCGRPRLLEHEVDLVLGVDPDRPRRDREIELEPGATLLLYTDGLLERRDDPDDRAVADLLALVGDGAELSLPELCDHLVRGTTADTGDDIAVLAVRLAG